jgi:hypothetical protein
MFQATLLGYNLGHYTNYKLQQDTTINAIVKLQHYAGWETLSEILSCNYIKQEALDDGRGVKMFQKWNLLVWSSAALW